MFLLLSLLLGLTPLTGDAAQPTIQPLSFDAAAFHDAFNAARNQPRLVLVVSPTCGHCLRLASEVQELLAAHPDSAMKVFVLWAPYMATDNQMAAERALAYLSDRRVMHFWDLWRFGTRTYTEQLKLPVTEAWDMLAFYEPRLQWEDELPNPTFWMQDRQLEIGTPYSKEGLAQALEPWWKK